MVTYETFTPEPSRGRRRLSLAGSVAVPLLAALAFWAALAATGPLPEPAEVPDWHGNVAVAR